MLAHAAWIFLMINDNNALVVKWCTAKQVDLHPPSVIAGLQIHKIHPHTTKLELCMYISVSQNTLGSQHAILFCKLPEAPPLESNVSPAAVVTASTGISVLSSVLGRGLADVNGSWVFVVGLVVGVVGVVVEGLWSVMIVSEACTETLDLVALHNRLEPYEKRSAKKG